MFIYLSELLIKITMILAIAGITTASIDCSSLAIFVAFALSSLNHVVFFFKS